VPILSAAFAQSVRTNHRQAETSCQERGSKASGEDAFFIFL